MVAFLLLFWLWVALTAMKIQICAGYGELCAPRETASSERSPRPL
jgi:hypothetical protein